MIKTVKRGGKRAFSWSVGALLGVSTLALTSLGETRNPYNAIVQRNVFGLRPPPPVFDPATLVKRTPPPKVLLTGITTILGKKVAFLTLPPTVPGPPDSEMLAEGQALNEVEVKIIDERAGVVVIENHGERQTLDFDHDGAKPSGPPAGIGPGGMAMPSPMSMPPPAMPAPNVLSMPQPGNVIRPLRSQSTRNQGAGNNNFSGFGGGLNGPNGVAQNQGQQLSPEEQVALIELQRAKAIQEGNPMSKIYPNTPFTSEVTGEPPPPGLPPMP